MMNKKSEAIKKMFHPASIAIIGASQSAGKQGNSVIRYLKRYGYQGRVYPVNPKADQIEGFPCYPSVTAIPDEVDLAVISLPNRLVPQAARDCIAKGIHAAVVWSAGFGELKSETGKQLDAELRQICEEGELYICGPNSLGVINAHEAAVASFTTALTSVEQLRKGNVAFISQSGGTVAAILDEIERGGLGFSMFVSTGNELNLSFSDYALELLEQDSVDFIVGYVEGIRDGEGFLRAGRRARELGKHIILVKGGRSGAAADAVSSHTGAIAGSDGIYTAAFREVGIIQAQSTEEMMDMVFALSGQGLDPDRFGRKALVLCTGGGSGIQALDAIERSPLKPASLSAESITRIKAIVPEFAGVTSHMIDVTPQMLMDAKYLAHFDELLQIIEEDPGVDVTLFVQASSAPSAPAVCRSIERHRETAKKPIILTWWALPDNARELLKAANIYVFPSQARAINFLAGLAAYCEIKDQVRVRTAPAHEKPDIAWPMPDLSKGPVVLTEDKVSPWLANYAIGNASACFAENEDAVAAAAAKIGYPVVLKVINEGLGHRSKYGLVALDIRDEAMLREKCALLRANAKKNLGLESIQGFWVQAFRPNGLELIVGGFKSEPFGRVMVCGVGGYLAEYFKPVYRLLPIDEEEAGKMVEELPFIRRYPEGVDLDALKQALLNFSNMMLDCPWEAFELELNPVKVLKEGEGVVAVDALAVLRK